MRVADIFCGAGLLSEGFLRAGFEPVLALDMDADAIKSYRRNIAEVAEVADVAKIKKGISADVLLAGPPCQGFSTLGRRDPRDKRNELSLLIPDWASSLGVSTVIVENVPQFLKSPYWKEMTGRLKKDGFVIDTWVLNSADYGVPQKRLRAFTIAVKGEMPVKPLARPRVAASSVFDTPIAVSDSMHIWPEPTGIAEKRIKRIPANGGKRDLMLGYPGLCPESWFRLGTQATDVWGRMNPSVPSNTLRCCFQNPSKGRYLHPSKNRAISLREGARIQGIPDSWEFEGSRTSVARQIGNGVPVPLAEVIADAVAKADFRSVA